MGYTHYWRFNNLTNDNEKNYQKAIKECQKVISYYQKTIKSINIKHPDRLSGYSAHTSKYGGVSINGTGKYGHEDFILREHFNQNEGFNFCKTARKPYDIVVIACLSVLKYRLGDSIEVSSDGEHDEWIDGVELACTVLNRKISNPIKDDNNNNNECIDSLYHVVLKDDYNEFHFEISSNKESMEYLKNSLCNCKIKKIESI